MSVTDELKKNALFKEVSDVDLLALVERMEKQHFEPGTVLFRAGDPGEDMYIIQSGTIRIFMHDEAGREVTLTTYTTNEIFGELSPIDQRPRSASAEAQDALHVLVLHRNDFLDFLHERPQIGMAMMRGLAKRLRYTTTYLQDYKPKRFETPIAPKGEEFRPAARPEIAELIDRVNQPEADTPQAAQASPETPPVEKSDKATEDPAASPGMGIFGRIAARQEEKGKDTKSD